MSAVRRLLCLVGLPLLLVGLLTPFLPLLLWSVAGGYRFPALLPAQTTGRGLRLLTDPQTKVLTGLENSTVIAVSVAVVAGLIGLSAGRALGMHRFRGRRLVQFLLLAPIIVPGLAVTLGIQVFFIRYGLAGTRLGVVLVHLVPTIPYVTLVMSSVYANFDPAYEEQARVLGAGPVQVQVRVTLPAVLPGLAVAALFAFLISWSEYILTLLVGGGSVQTLPLLLFAYVGSADVNAAAVLGLALVLPPMLLLGLTAVLLSGRPGPAGERALAGLGRV